MVFCNQRIHDPERNNENTERNNENTERNNENTERNNENTERNNENNEEWGKGECDLTGIDLICKL